MIDEKGVVFFMLWEVKPNYFEYDLYDGAIIVAETKDEAERIANVELKHEYNSWAWYDDKPQVWTAKLLDLAKAENGVVFTSFNAG